MPVPNTFANATATIPLTQLDANFATTITLGNTAIQLGNTVTTLNDMTLANVNISSGIVTITNATVTTANVTNLITGNAAITGGAINGTTLGATTASTANVTTLTTSSTVTINGGTANQVQYLDGSKVLVGSANLTFNGTTLSAAGLSDSGNLTFTGTGNRITGDFSNATLANRVMFQTSTANSPTQVRVIPNGTGTLATLQVGNNNDPNNQSVISLGATATSTDINSFATGTGTYLPMTFNTNGSERMRIDTSGNVGIGTSSPAAKLSVSGTATFGTGTWPTASIGLSDSRAGVLSSNENGIFLVCNTSGTVAANNGGEVRFGATATTSTANASQCAVGGYKENATSGNFAGYLAFKTSDSSGTIAERARITSGGDFLVAKITRSNAAGIELRADGEGYFVRSGAEPMSINRLTNDGTLVGFYQDTTLEGSISVSGTTVSYNGGHLARWSQLLNGQRDESIVKGTVLSNLDEMCEWTDAEGNPLPNEQLNRMKVSDVEGDTNVAGVFVNWDNDDQDNLYDMNIAMTGDMIIRIAQGVTVQKGDLLMSAGDGTAKPQGDDIVRSKTVAKVTSNHVTCTYDDGSYCVPCVLMAC